MLADDEAENLNGWVFGCDICQDVCPWNRKAPSGRLAEFGSRPEWVEPDLIGWLEDDPAIWRARLKGTALTRAKRAGLLCATPLSCSATGDRPRPWRPWPPASTMSRRIRS